MPVRQPVLEILPGTLPEVQAGLRMRSEEVGRVFQRNLKILRFEHGSFAPGYIPLSGSDGTQLNNAPVLMETADATVQPQSDGLQQVPVDAEMCSSPNENSTC